MTGPAAALAAASGQPRYSPAGGYDGDGDGEDDERGRVRGRGRDGAGRDRAETGAGVEAQVPGDADCRSRRFSPGDERLRQRQVLQAAVSDSGQDQTADGEDAAGSVMDAVRPQADGGQPKRPGEQQ